MGTRVRIAAGALALALVLASLGVLGATTPAAVGQATTTTVVATTQVPITVIVAIPGPLPNGLLGYRVETICRGVSGVVGGGPVTVISRYPREGGRTVVFQPLQRGSNCTFRLFSEGTGPRGLSGNVIQVGGVDRPITFPAEVDGISVEVGTVLESSPIPVEAPTEVVIGQVQVPVVAPTTTVPPTTLPPTTAAATTAPAATRPATTVPTTTAPAATAPATTAPPSTAPPPPTTRVPALATTTTRRPTTTTRKAAVRKRTTTTTTRRARPTVAKKATVATRR